MSIKKLPGYESERKNLDRLELLNPKLIPSSTLSFIEYSDQLHRRFRKKSNSQEDLVTLIQIVMHILKREHSDKTLVYTIKKCAFLHAFAHQLALTQTFSVKTSQLLMSYLTETVNEGIVAENSNKKNAKNNEPVKREGSLNRIYNAIRSLSSSKEREREKSKMKVESSGDKGALKEIISKVVHPLCSYIMKITQDHTVYSYILYKEIDKSVWEQLKWKIHNLMKILGKLVLELNRLGKYYKEDIMGSWVLLYFIMSTDIATYYNLIVSDLSQRSQRWKEKISMVLKIGKINRRHTSELQQIFHDPKFIEFKDQLQMMNQIKESFFYLYYNVQMQKWVHLLEVPFQTGEKRRKMESIEYILDFYQRYGQKYIKPKAQQESKISEKPKNSSLKKKSSSESNLQNVIRRSPLLEKVAKEEDEKEVVTHSSTIRRNNFIAKREI